MKEIILCADDAGLSEEIDRAIVALAARGRLSAASVLVNSPRLVECARLLEPVREQLQLGLHFDLTEFTPSADPALRRSYFGWVTRALSGTIPQRPVAEEFRAQLSRFRQVFGRDPDFVDGHQHIQLLPGLRSAILRALAGEESLRRRIYVRTGRDGRHFHALSWKAAAMSWLSRGLEREAAALGVRVAPGLRGIYDFHAPTPYSQAFADFLTEVPEGALLLCHPATEERAHPGDPLHERRVEEFQFLSGEEMEVALTVANVMVATGPSSRTRNTQ